MGFLIVRMILGWLAFIVGEATEEDESYTPCIINACTQSALVLGGIWSVLFEEKHNFNKCYA